MTKREWAEHEIYALYNVAEHVYRGSQSAQHDLKYSPAQALAALENVRDSASRMEMHLTDAIERIRGLIADPDRPDHPAQEVTSARLQAWLTAKGRRLRATELADLRQAYQAERVNEIAQARRFELSRAVPGIAWLRAEMAITCR